MAGGTVGRQDDAHRDLKAVAHDDRSPLKETPQRLPESVRYRADDITALLERIRRQHTAVSALDLSEAALRELRNTGRP